MSLPTQKESLPVFQEDISNTGIDNDVTLASRDGDDPDRIKISLKFRLNSILRYTTCKEDQLKHF